MTTPSKRPHIPAPKAPASRPSVPAAAKAKQSPPSVPAAAKAKQSAPMKKVGKLKEGYVLKKYT